MARMIDPSTLEGEDLDNWYGRTPAEVEAEREAVRQERYQAFVQSIGSPAPQSDASANEYDDRTAASPGQTQAIDGDSQLIKAYYRPAGPIVAPPPVMPPPSGPQAGPSLDARGSPAIGGAGSGFFGTHSRDYSPALGAYSTDLPWPLNTVTPSANPNWFELGDGNLASRDEVERIYAEHKRRLKGQDEVPPAANVQIVDRLPTGQIPRADQMAKRERELDPSCSPYGGWERDPGFPRYSQRTQDYETQVTRAPGLDYVVRVPGEKPVKFDGCAVWDPRHPLLEAKGPGYAPLLPKALQWGFYGNMLRGAVDQAERQKAVAPRQLIEWHIAEPGALRFFRDATSPDRPPIVLKQTPPRY